MHLQEQYRDERNPNEDLWMSYDLVYNRKKYSMDKNLAEITDLDLELTLNSCTKQTPCENLEHEEIKVEDLALDKEEETYFTEKYKKLDK